MSDDEVVSDEEDDLVDSDLVDKAPAGADDEDEDDPAAWRTLPQNELNDLSLDMARMRRIRADFDIDVPAKKIVQGFAKAH